MFANPPRIVAEVFATLPPALRLSDERAAWLVLHKRGASMGSFLEGPSFDADGNLYLTDIPFGRIFKVDANGRFTEVLRYDGQPNGLKFSADGTAWVADHLRGLLRLDLNRGTVDTVLGGDSDGPFHGLNDLFFANDGACWFTDQGQSGLHDPFGRVFRWRVSEDAPVRVLGGVPSPNGIVVEANGASVLLAVTRANAVWRLPVLLDGSTAKVGLFIQLSGGFGPDGMALDCAGNLAVCHPGLGAAWLFNPRGEPILRIDSPVGATLTNCAFGGKDNRSLYLTEAESGTVLRAEMPYPGEQMAWPRASDAG